MKQYLYIVEVINHSLKVITNIVCLSLEEVKDCIKRKNDDEEIKFYIFKRLEDCEVDEECLKYVGL